MATKPLVFQVALFGYICWWSSATPTIISSNALSDGSFALGLEANLTCEINPYTFSQTWTVDSVSVADCGAVLCFENPSNPERYSFTSDTGTGIFIFTINPIKLSDDGNVIGCFDGADTFYFHVNVTDQAERVKNCSCKCNISRSLGFLVFTVAGLYGMLYYKKDRIAWTQQTLECITTTVFCSLVCCVLLLFAVVGLILAFIEIACKVKDVCITGIGICGFDVIVLVICVIIVCKKNCGEDRETGSASTNHGGLFLSSECSDCSAHALSFIVDGLLLIIAAVGLIFAFKINERDETKFCTVEVAICAFDVFVCLLAFISGIFCRKKALIEPPQNLRCEEESLTHTSATIIWEKGYSAYPYESYHLLYKDDKEICWKTEVLNDHDKMSVKTVRYSLDFLQPGSRYQVKVKAENKDGESDFTDLLHFTTKVHQQTSSQQGVEEDAIQQSQEMETALF